MEIVELAFMPTSAAGHLGPMVEFSKSLTSRIHNLSVTIFIMELPFQSKIDSYIQTLLSNQYPPRVRFVHLTLDKPTADNLCTMPSGSRITELVNINKSRVKDFYSSSSAKRLPAAFVVDVLNTASADVANEFWVPTYVFVTSNACCLSLMFFLLSTEDDQNQDMNEFNNEQTDLCVPGFVNPFPSVVLPSVIFDKENGWSDIFFDVPRQARKAKGILINTFEDLEPCPIKFLSEDETLPPIYAIGPVLNHKILTPSKENEIGQYESIIMWLDNQSQDSVVFLCFGSMGALEAKQVVEIALSLEQGRHKFLWSLQKPSIKENVEPSKYENLNDVLPEGFLDRTKEIGKVIGWAPQIAVLSHPAVGGFVSHCGWNSMLESLWCGVPVATWPLYQEQQMNAFEMVKELGLAFEIKLDYRMDNPVLLTAAEIGGAIKELMDEGSETRKKVSAMSEKSRMAVAEGGSSYSAVGYFIENVFNSMSQTSLSKQNVPQGE